MPECACVSIRVFVHKRYPAHKSDQRGVQITLLAWLAWPAKDLPHHIACFWVRPLSNSHVNPTASCGKEFRDPMERLTPFASWYRMAENQLAGFRLGRKSRMRPIRSRMKVPRTSAWMSGSAYSRWASIPRWGIRGADDPARDPGGESFRSEAEAEARGAGSDWLRL